MAGVTAPGSRSSYWPLHPSSWLPEAFPGFLSAKAFLPHFCPHCDHFEETWEKGKLSTWFGLTVSLHERGLGGAWSSGFPSPSPAPLPGPEVWPQAGLVFWEILVTAAFLAVLPPAWVSWTLSDSY